MLVNTACVIAFFLVSSACPTEASRFLSTFRELNVHVDGNESDSVHLAISALRQYGQYAPEVIEILRDGSSLERLEMMMKDPQVEEQAQRIADTTIPLLQGPDLSRQWKKIMTDPDFQYQAHRITNRMTQEMLGDPHTLPVLKKIIENDDFQKQARCFAESVVQVMRRRTRGHEAHSHLPEGRLRQLNADSQGTSGIAPATSFTELRASQSKWSGGARIPKFQIPIGVSNSAASWLARSQRAPAHTSTPSGGSASPTSIPRVFRGRARFVPSMRPSGEEKPRQTGSVDTPSGVVAAGVLASSAAIAEAVQLAGTAVLLSLGQTLAGTDNPVETVAALIAYIKGLGVAGYGVFAVAMVFLQVVPIAAAFILTVTAGAMFGAVKGTAIVLSCSTLSATISFLIARLFGRDLVLEAAKGSKTFTAIDKAFNATNFSQALTVVTLLRLSPVLPFAWANYVFGLTPVPAAAFSLGTFLGALPNVAAYVTAGQAGAEVAINGLEGQNPFLLALGGAATFGAISLTGNIATKALQDADIDLEEEEFW